MLSLMDMVSVLRSSNTSSTTFPSSGMENTTSRGPADVAPEPKRINELHTGSSLFISVVGIMESGVDRANGFCDD